MRISIADAKKIPRLKTAVEQIEKQTKEHKQKNTNKKEIDTGAQLIIDMFKALF